jgi:hypothetical protein
MKKRRDFRRYDSTRNCCSCRVKDSHEMQKRCVLYFPNVRREKNRFGGYAITECSNILPHGWCKWGHPDFVRKVADK